LEKVFKITYLRIPTSIYVYILQNDFVLKIDHVEEVLKVGMVKEERGK
jgi:hypothetical protein